MSLPLGMQTGCPFRFATQLVGGCGVQVTVMVGPVAMPQCRGRGSCVGILDNPEERGLRAGGRFWCGTDPAHLPTSVQPRQGRTLG